MESTENEIWRMIPPEEKFELMAKAQSKGVAAVATAIGVLCTISVGLKMSWLMWFGFIISPFVFQFAAGKAWRSIRPRALLEYLAVRSASRRFAFGTRSKELTPKMILKGTLERIYDNDHIQEAMEAIIAQNKSNEVWVTLFGDAFTMIAEAPGGAEVKLAALLDSKVSISSTNESGGDYSNNKQVFITISSKDSDKVTYKLTSKYPAALVVFEKRAKQIIGKGPNFDDVKELIDPALLAASQEDGRKEDKFNSLFSF
jgi:hypothetical protein